MRRRDCIAGIGATAAWSTWPLEALAQNLPVIGWLGGESREVDDFRVIPFRQGLKDAGYIEGRNVAIEYRWADAQYDRLPALAADLVRRQVNVIVVTGLPPALAAKAATATIPIVFQFAADPVELGFVASLNRPGGNITGVTSLNVEVAPKQLELVHELVPAATDIALLVNPTNQLQSTRTTRDARVAVNALGLRLHVLHASTERDFDTVFATLGQLQAGALVIAPDPLFAGWQQQLGTLTVRHAVPAISPYSGFAMAGGLMSYGADLSDVYRRVGAYTSRILKGEEPKELPVQQAVKIEFVINLKTAKALRLMLPTALLVRADVVIE